MLIQSHDDPAVGQTINTAVKLLRKAGYPVTQSLTTVLEAGLRDLIIDALQERLAGQTVWHDCIRYRFERKPYLALLTPHPRLTAYEPRDGVSVIIAAVLPPTDTIVQPDLYDRPMESFYAGKAPLDEEDKFLQDLRMGYAAKTKLIRATWRGRPIPHPLDKKAARREAVLEDLRPILPRPVSG